MTVSTATSFNSYAGNGSTTSFAYAFKIFQDSNLVVTLVNDTTGVETTQTLTTDYTVTGAGSDSGGSVVFGTAPALGNTVVIRRVLPVTQETNYVPNDPFPAEAHEDALDKLTMLVQQEVASSELAVQFPEGDVGSGINNILPSVTGRSDKLLKFGLDGGVEVIAASDLSNAIIGANYSVDTFTGTGSTTVYTLSSEPGSKANTAIYIDGVYQAKANYSVSGSTLTFTTAPPLNSAIEIVIGDAIPAGSATTASAVSYTQGGTGAVTTNVQAKLRETVSVKDFGAVGDGVTDDLAAFHAAMTASKNVFVPDGTYYLSATLEMQQGGQRLIGVEGSASGGSLLYPTHTGGITVRNTFSDVEIAHLWIYVRDSSGGADDGTGFYQASGAWLNLHDCTFYNPDSTGNSGTGIVLDDRDTGGSFVAGSYTHVIDHINMARGNNLATGIKTAGTSGGINASRITNCHIISDNCIEWNYGGGNLIQGNLLQTSTGTIGTPAGKGYNAVNAGSNMLVGNYMEKFAYDVYNGSTVTGSAPIVSNHHTDNSTAVNGFGGGSYTMPFFVDQSGVHNLTVFENAVSVTADSQAIPTNQAVVRIAGDGVARASCTLSTDNARDGQMLYVRGDSWSVQIVESTTANFGPYGSNDGLIFGTAGSSINFGGVTRPLMKSALFMYRASISKWELLEATPHRYIGGNFEYIDVNADATEINTDASSIYITGNGAARSNCTLEAPVVDGQSLTILATSWAVTIVPSTTAVFESAAASVTFGNTTAQIQSMSLIAYNGKWYENGRAVT